MPKTVGIVAEYNPFHTGHQYQIDTLRTMGFDKIAVAMSGSCVQRGEFALLSKFARAQIALDCGVNLVCEIPFPYSSLSAEGFARSGMFLLKNLNVDAVSFGSESDDIALLSEIARYLLSDQYTQTLQKNLSQKLPYAVAREKAILSEFQTKSAIIKASNDILGIEYIKACFQMDWHPQFVPIKRKGANYNDALPKNGYASASYLRNGVSQFKFEQSLNFIPPKGQKIYLSKLEQGQFFTKDASFEKALFFQLRRLSPSDFEKIPDCNTELAHAFETALCHATHLEELFQYLPTKMYPRARLNRIMLFAFLGAFNNYTPLPPFIRLLGMDNLGEEIIKEGTKTCEIPLSHSYKLLEGQSETIKNSVLLERFATDAQCTFMRFSQETRQDYSHKIYKPNRT